MPQSKDPLQSKQEALDAWERLPKGTPSRKAMPPASDGLGSFWRLFLRGLASLREHKAAMLLFLVLLVVVLGALMAWR